eukprot:scaffold64401_cov14-Tisochrysis_lutea.AAC.1
MVHCLKAHVAKTTATNAQTIARAPMHSTFASIGHQKGTQSERQQQAPMPDIPHCHSAWWDLEIDTHKRH